MKGRGAAPASPLHGLVWTGQSLDAYLRLALDELGDAVGYSDASIMAYDPDVLLPTAASSTSPRDPTDVLHACRNEQLEPDLLKYRELARMPTHVGVLSLREGAADPRRASPRWRERVVPAGHRHEVRAALVDGRTGCWGALTLLRDRPAFNQREVRLVARATGVLARGIARATVQTPGAPGPPPAAGVLLADGRGRLIDATGCGLAWLDELAAAGAPGQPAAAIAMLAAESDPREEAPRLRLHTRSGRWVQLHAERLTEAIGPGRIAIVVEPVHAGAILPLACAAYGLTRRESDVVAALLQGLTSKEAAARLAMSANTVQDHLKSVFDKVGVRSRGELAHRLALQPW